MSEKKTTGKQEHTLTLEDFVVCVLPIKKQIVPAHIFAGNCLVKIAHLIH